MPENYKILAVNDDPDQLEIKEFLLLNAGFRVLTAQSGNEAYTVAQRERPDLIISDVLMPDGDGIELCRLIRANEKLRFIPILLVSALQKDTANVVKGLEAGADDYMELPYEPMRLIAKAARLIERKRVEDALRESENRFRNLIENLTDIISILAPDGTVIYESPSLEHILGYKPEELIGKKIFTFIHPEDAPEVIEYFASAIQSTEVVSPIEYRFRHKNKSWRIFESVGKPFNDPINGLVAVINSRDITEQRNALKAKRESENRLRTIFDNAAIGIALVDTKGQPIESNPALQKMLGYSGKELRRMPFAEFTHPDDLAEDLILAQEIFEGKRNYYQIEKRYIKKNGEIMWGNLTASVIRIDGETPFVCGMVEDITDRKLAETALRESEERFKAQYKGIPVPTLTWRRMEEDFVLAEFNDATEKITQNKIMDYLGTKASEFFDNSPEVLKNINRCFNEKTTLQHETLHRLKTTGESKHLDISYVFVPPDMVMVHSRDVTEQRQAEESLRESENRFQMVSRATNDALWDWDLLTDSLWMNEVYYKLLGRLPGKVEPNIKLWYEGIHPEDKERVINGLKSVLEGGDNYWVDEYRLLSTENSVAYVFDRGHIIYSEDGKPVRMIGAAIDITERKRVQEQLDHFFNVSVDLLCFVGFDGYFKRINPAWKKLLGYKEDELLSKPFIEFVHPDDREYTLKEAQGNFKGQKTISFENRYLCRDGSYKWLLWNSATLPDEQMIYAVAHDITERKQIENALRESKEHLALAQQAGRIGSFELNLQTMQSTSSAALETLYGVSPGELNRKYENWAEYVHPEDLPKAKQELERALSSGEHNAEFRILQNDGSVRWIYSTGKVFYNEAGIPQRLVGVNMDVTERKLAESTLHFQKILLEAQSEASIDGILVVTPTGEISFHNQRFAEMWGISNELLAAKSDEKILESIVEKLVKPQEFLDTVSYLYQNPFIKNQDEVLLTDGRTFERYSAPVIDADETYFGRVWFFRDITNRKKTEEAIRFQAHLLDTVEQAVIATNLEGVVIYWNRFAEKLYGWSAEEAVARSIMELTTPEISHEQSVKIMAQLSVGKSWAGEFIVQNKEGTTFPAQVFNSPITDVDGELIGVVGISVDITDQKEAEIALAEANERAIREYDSLLQRLNTLAQTIGTDRNLTAIFGAILDFAALSIPCSSLTISLYNREQSTRKVIYMWYNGKEADVSALESVPVGEGSVGQAIRSGEVKIVNDYLQTAGKKPTHVFFGFEEDSRKPRSTIIAPMKIMGNAIGVIEIQSYERDAYAQEHATAMRMAANLGANAIENVRLLEQERHNAEMLRQAQKLESIGRLAGGIAHDFNNMLTAINGYSGMILRQLAQDDPLRPKVEEIKKAGDRSASLTHQLLAFSRRQILKPKVLDINEVLIDTSKMLQRLIGEDIQLNILPNPRIGRVEVDPGQLTQVIMNLAVNARDAMPDGGSLIIETSNVELDEKYAALHVPTKPGSYVMLAVTDTGSGMDNETMKQIFEPFYTTKEVGKGTGLGLSTVYGIVKQSGGYIWVYSELGKGTTFKIYFPRLDEEVKEDKSNSTFENAPFGNETILLVEDEESVLNFARETLETCGYKVIEARNGAEALSVYKKSASKIDLLITDVVMPKMGGRKLAEKITRMNPQIPQLFMSGYTDDTIIRQGMITEDMTFIQKPFTFEMLAHKVRELLDKK
jgi:PAS domain S-box-containing protein